MKVDITLQVKLGSLIVHLEEFIDTGEPFDLAAANALQDDADVIKWFEQMRAAALLPIKRGRGDG